MASAEFRMKLPIPKQSPSSATGAIVNSIHKNVRLVAFADAGAVAGNSLINNFYQRGNMGASVGLGLRLNLPYVGLVRLDYGIPLLSTALGRLTPRMTVGFGDKF
jgi:outer membrane protein assembly factor BamA